MSIRDRAAQALEMDADYYEELIEIIPRKMGDTGSPAHAVQFNNASMVVVASQGEVGVPDLVGFDRNSGSVLVKLWPEADTVHYVECEIRPNPDGVLIWGAVMGDTSVSSQLAVQAMANGKAIQYFTLPPFSSSSDGMARFSFTMQDQKQGNWNLMRIRMRFQLPCFWSCIVNEKRAIPSLLDEKGGRVKYWIALPFAIAWTAN